MAVPVIRSLPALAAAMRTTGRRPFNPVPTALMRERVLVPMYRVSNHVHEREVHEAIQSVETITERIRRLAAAYGEWDAFDPGAKYHIPGNTPYTRYFLARILQFQFYKAACDQAGWEGPLHRCSFYGNEEVGKNLGAMLEMGASKPWPDALEAFTGERQMSGNALVEYFAPLKDWLDEQNKGKPTGW